MPRIFRTLARLSAVVVLGVTTLWVALAYQPYRHSLYNNTHRALWVVQEHYGRIIEQGKSADVNPLIDTPLRAQFLLNKVPQAALIRFDADGSLSLRYRLESAEPVELRPPKDWARANFLWREFHYQLEPDGRLYLLHPSQPTAVKQFLPQPPGFPIRISKQ